MSSSEETTNSTVLSFQTHKLHINVPGRVKNFFKLEHDMTLYFETYGFVEDLKVLRKSDLSRRLWHLRFRYIQRRVSRSGGPQRLPHTQR